MNDDLSFENVMRIVAPVIKGLLPTARPPPIEPVDGLPDMIPHGPGQFVLKQAVHDRYPLADLEEFKRLLRFACTPEEQAVAFSHGCDLATELLTIRMRSPICENPTCAQPKGSSVTYFICQCCEIVLYCSRNCQAANHELHRIWSAGLPHSPQPHYCPQRPALIGNDIPRVKYIHNNNGDIINEVTGEIVQSCAAGI